MFWSRPAVTFSMSQCLSACTTRHNASSPLDEICVSPLEKERF